MNDLPLFSIAIPTYNRLELLKKAVASALSQTYLNIEVIVLNDCSIDGTKMWLDEIVKQESKIRVINNSQNLGCVGNIKSIPKYVNGKYLGIISDDDLLEAEFAAEAVKDLESNSSAVIWYCRGDFIMSNENISRATKFAPRLESGLDFVKKSLKGERESLWAVFRMDVLHSVGGIVADTITMDLATNWLCALKGDVLFNSKVLIKYFYYMGNTSTLSSLTTWFSAMDELHALVKKNASENLDFECAYHAFLSCEWMYINRKSWVERKGVLKVGFLPLFKKSPFLFIFLFIKRLPILLVRSLPAGWYWKICNYYWKIRYKD
jgi:glycosyltransferase involved in cell wall biosynthesis